MEIAITVVIFLVAVVIFVLALGSGSKHDSQQRQTGIDSWNIPDTLSQDEQTEIKIIADFYGVRYVTGAETRKWILHNITEDFSAMPGWDVWDSSIHESDGQFERVERGTSEKNISILCYDPKYKIAKVQGKTGIYLTSCNRCSCPDFRKRRLPCKHMYALAIKLEGDVQREILDTVHAPLYGLVLALAGHLPKSTKGVGGIRADISERGGKWSNNIEFESSAVVVGTDPSIHRLDRIKTFDIETLSPEAIQDIFSAHTSSGA